MSGRTEVVGGSLKARAIAMCTLLVMDVLRIEARDELVRFAELGASENALDVSEDAKRWYGLNVNVEQHQQLVAKRTLLEVALETAKAKYEAAVIRRDTSRRDWAQQIRTLRDELAEVDTAIWTLEQTTVAQVEQQRELDVEERAVQLYERYLTLAQSLPFNVYHPAVPEFFRRWVLKQRDRGALAVPEYALLVYVFLRDTVFTGVWNVPPVLEDDELPIGENDATGNPLEATANPRTKTEARWNRLLAQQFVHANGDRRVDRDSQLTRLHYERLAAEKNGRRFTERYDFEAEPDYWGLPTLEALTNPGIKPCGECGAPIIDRVVESHQDTDGKQWFRGVTKCDCTKEILTPDFAAYDDAFEAVMQLSGNGHNAAHFRRRRALQRAQVAA